MSLVSRAQQGLANLTSPTTAPTTRTGGTAAAGGVNVKDLLRLSARPAPALSGARPGGYGLAVGSSGPEVAKLQNDLRVLGYFQYPNNTGYFGAETEAALKTFQSDQHRKQDGVADAGTLEAVKAALASAPAGAVVAPQQDAIAVDESVQPRSRSTLPGHQAHVEQGGEFVSRYFKSQGKDYPTEGQAYSFFMSGRDVQGNAKPQFERNTNGGAQPPQAGDILVAKGPKPGEYHTTLITKVDGDKVTVLQANVPCNWQGGKELEATYDLKVVDGNYSMPPLPLGSRGFSDDFRVAGWIHPTGKDALPKQ